MLAWVGVLIRDQEVGEDARMRVFFSPELSSVERDRQAEGLREAQLFNPDSSWELLHGSYLLLSGPPERAAAVAEDLVREEPDNIAAWGLLSQSTRTRDPIRSAQAAGEIRRLDPLGSHSIVPGAPPAP